MALETIKSEYKQLSDIEHVRLRSEMYTGSKQLHDIQRYLLHADGKAYLDNVKIAPATLTLANELICNSFDEAVRTRDAAKDRAWQLSRIDVIADLQRHSLTVKDDGGIKVAIDAETNMPIGTLLFGHLRTGSNYTDERGDVSGVNGIGAVLCNILSENFHLLTADGKHMFQQSWHQNLEVADEPVITDSKEHFTQIIAEFDVRQNRVGMDASAYGLDWARCIEMRCAEVAAMSCGWNKPLTVTFKCIQVDGTEWFKEFCFRNFRDYLKLWPNNEAFVVDEQYRFNIALGLSNGSCESSAIVNALQCPWGSHIDAFLDACVFHMRAHINARYKIDVKPAKLKSYLKAVSTWQINAATFSGQTKEVLVSDIKTFGMPVIPSEQFIKKLLRSDIMGVIIEELHNRIAAQRKAELDQVRKEIDKKTRKNIMPDKLTDAVNAGRGKYCRLFVVEGDSAALGLRKMRNPETDGTFALFGKSAGNSMYADEFRILANKAMSTLCQGLGFTFVDSRRLRYNDVVIATDADPDGTSICGLLLTFFNKFMPDLIESGRLYRLATPLLTAKNHKTAEICHFYAQSEFDAVKANYPVKQWDIHYCKGLASLEDSDYEIIMANPRLIQLVKDDFTDTAMMTWFGNDPSKRKEAMAMADLIAEDFDEMLGISDEPENTESNDNSN